MSNEESVCGETTDHEDRMTYEDSDTEYWECARCGAEWWQEKEA